LAENLKSTKFNDNTSIRYVIDNDAWYNITIPGYCRYDNDSSCKVLYGALYNWNTVSTGKICPTGWHLLSSDEWTTLTAFIGGTSGGGVKMKETGTIHWVQNTQATNGYGFTALVGPQRSLYGVFYWIGVSTTWWSSTKIDENEVTSSISSEANIRNI
jgi:uncharacterized protein (TIGR02145 family)